MKSLRIRFAIGFSVLFTLILGTALVIIYFSFAHFRKDEFNKRLKDHALTTFKFLLEVEQIDQEILSVIDKNTLNSLYDEKVLIFKGKELIYQSIDDEPLAYDDKIFQRAKKEKVVFTTHQEHELVALNIVRDNIEYTLLASAYDTNGRRILNFLGWMITIVYCLGICIGWIATYIFVKQMIKPLEHLNADIENISSENLHTRLKENHSVEEVENLASNFNKMLERLQESFQFQRDFVHYASHELRTPLTVMVGVTENALTKNLSAEQHKEILKQLFSQQQELTEITNSLLLLSDKSMNLQQYPGLRLDELLDRSVDIISNIFPNASITVNMEGNISNEELLTVNVNEPLLLMAFNNLLRNAVQYSTNGEVIITLRFREKKKEIEFKNIGTFFPDDNESKLFVPFYRGANAASVKGHGLGLTLVKQIAELHHATITYQRNGEENIFTFSFMQ